MGAGDSRPGLSDGGWRFGYGFPEFAIMPEKKFEHPQPQAARDCRATPALPRGHGHAEAADVRAGSQGPTEIAGVTGKDDIARGQPYSQRLVSWGVTVGRQTDKASVAEQVVLTIH